MSIQTQREQLLEPKPPTCNKCGAKMWLSYLSPLAPGNEERTYRCSICSNAQTIAVQYP
jgi:DNA-directed RNA polymerase subunit RPC12/RpoP